MGHEIGTVTVNSVRQVGILEKLPYESYSEDGSYLEMKKVEHVLV